MQLKKYISVFPSGPFATNAYLLFSAGRCVIIDPAPDSLEDIRREVADQDAEVEKILITHSHWDHIGDCAAALEEWPVPLLIHPLDADNLRSPGADGLPLFMPISGATPTALLEDGDSVACGELTLKVMHTPGHSPGSVCFYCASLGFLFSGDLLFKGSIGRLDLPTGQPEGMWPSLARVAALPAGTVVYPGHGEPTTIGAESWLSDAEKIFG